MQATLNSGKRSPRIEHVQKYENQQSGPLRRYDAVTIKQGA